MKLETTGENHHFRLISLSPKMARITIVLLFWFSIIAGIFVANYAVEHHWAVWTITLAGAFFLLSVLGYVFSAEPD